MLSQEAIEKILGIQDTVALSPQDMAPKLTLTFFPYDPKKCAKDVLAFADLLRVALTELGIRIIPYEDALETVPAMKVAKRFSKIVGNNLLYYGLEALRREHGYYHVHWGAIGNLANRRRVRKGVSVIALGGNKASRLPIDFTSSFTQSSVITILDRPKDVDEKSDFAKHFDTAMDAFSYHMTQIVILVDSQKWILYNFNASHPVYPIHSDLKKHILDALVPKIAAPIRPQVFRDFVVEQESFDIDAEPYASNVADLIDGATLFDKTRLYPAGKKIRDLPFRNGFYRWIGQIHLDHRSGMSYGFLARQLPSMPVPLVPFAEAIKRYGIASDLRKDYFSHDGHLHIVLELPSGRYCMQVPPVWVLSQRSGADKTRVDPHKDILLLGMVDGKLHMRTPKGMRLLKDYRPSFDTKVILAHAVGNAIVASILATTDPKSVFLAHTEKQGLALAHWHGYIKADLVPQGFSVHGERNPHVACSTAQSAVFALQGKLEAFDAVLKAGRPYRGDVHIEPHHGTNITFASISELARFLLDNPDASVLGNKYLTQY